MSGKVRACFHAGLVCATLAFFPCACSDEGMREDYAETVEITVDTSSFVPSSGVMLQGFTWSSNFHDRYYGESAPENGIKDTSSSRSPGGSMDWYDVISENSGQIKDVFEYVWFPPAQDSLSDNGYMPRVLNVLDSFYGTEEQLVSAVQSISPAGALGDIVINHRVGTKNWGTFTNPSFGADYYAICSDDEGFSAKGSDMYGSDKRGAADTGEGYASARDIDHTKSSVQDAIAEWMGGRLMHDAGFVGWRYDFVKGFGGEYVGWYNRKTGAAFSVGEFWPTAAFSPSNPGAWQSQIARWVNSTAETVPGRQENGSPSRAFDFVTKGMLNAVFGSNGTGIRNSGYNLLADERTGIRSMPALAVTFVDNHDTGSTQNLWYLDPDDVGAAYAFILTHPGYPCVAWQHYFTPEESYDTSVRANRAQYLGGKEVPGTGMTYKDFIRKLIALRAETGITETSAVTVWSETGPDRYVAEIQGGKGSVVCNLGASCCMEANSGVSEASGRPFSDYALEISGAGFSVWSALRDED